MAATLPSGMMDGSRSSEEHRHRSQIDLPHVFSSEMLDRDALDKR